MSNILQNLAGMGNMTEQVIATDLLLSAKTGVRNYAVAISETVTPEVKEVLRRHLDIAIGVHERVLDYMIKNGYYRPDNPKEQIRVDMKAADTVLSIQQ